MSNLVITRSSVIQTTLAKLYIVLSFENGKLCDLIFDLSGLLFRRMRETVAAAGNGEISKVIVAGLSNVYTHYITTYEVLFPAKLTTLALFSKVLVGLASHGHQSVSVI